MEKDGRRAAARCTESGRRRPQGRFGRRLGRCFVRSRQSQARRRRMACIHQGYAGQVGRDVSAGAVRRRMSVRMAMRGMGLHVVHARVAVHRHGLGRGGLHGLAASVGGPGHARQQQPRAKRQREQRARAAERREKAAEHGRRMPAGTGADNSGDGFMGLHGYRLGCRSGYAAPIRSVSSHYNACDELPPRLSRRQLR